MTSRALAMRLSVLVASLLAAPPSVAAELACDRLLTAGAEEVLTTAHPGFSERRFTNGVSCTSDIGDPKGCDWEGRIVDDRVLDRLPDSVRRLIVLNDNHLTGSGAFDKFSVFDCENGRVRLAFSEAYLYGVLIQEATPRTLVLISGHWLKPDPTCCPSQRKRQAYRWDAIRRAYTLDDLTYLPVERSRE